ncbi:MAG: TetR/AcrR family transcriptional regulator [Porticoccaceae bacterium]
MPVSPVPPRDSPRAEARREQICVAAADCFRRHGFHGTSVARISKAAGMSPGHIYHYFENKEAIIAEIVARDLARVLTLIAELRSAHDVQDAMIARVAEGVADHVDADAAALRLEIAAEAARNPRIAAIVRAAEARSRADLADTLRSLRRAAGHADDDRHIVTMVDVIAAMFEGLQIRIVRNPGLDRARLTRHYQHLLGALLTQAADADSISD